MWKRKHGPADRQRDIAAHIRRNSEIFSPGRSAAARNTDQTRDAAELENLTPGELMIEHDVLLNKSSLVLAAIDYAPSTLAM
jgi:hypothetical protein